MDVRNRTSDIGVLPPALETARIDHTKSEDTLKTTETMPRTNLSLEIPNVEEDRDSTNAVTETSTSDDTPETPTVTSVRPAASNPTMTPITSTVQQTLRPSVSTEAGSAPVSTTGGSSTTPATVPSTHATRRRSTLDPRGSNRLSGFFSNLMHRQSTIQATNRPMNRPENSSATALSQSGNSKPASRAASPIQARPSSPPPPLPPPTLQELGLSLSVVTTASFISQLSFPPSNGTFLVPHFLLLCHAQGLDFVPLIGPPSPQPFPLVRRAPFKSVVVLEQRGVLVAIAGRSQSVRIYVLDEIRKAIEWRMEFEGRKEREKERDRIRREGAKKPLTIKVPATTDDLPLPIKSSTLAPSAQDRIAKTARRMSVGVPRTPTPNRPKPSATVPVESKPLANHEPRDQPPPYTSSPVESRSSTSRLQTQISMISLSARLPTVSPLHSVEMTDRGVKKTDTWADNCDASDEEAIDVLAAQSSGSQALDEGRNVRAMARRHSNARNPHAAGSSAPVSIPTPATNAASRILGISTLDTDDSTSVTVMTSNEPPSPAATLMSLRQALHSPRSENPPLPSIPADDDPDSNDEEDERLTQDRVSLAQILSESRIPSLPPAGTRRDQEPLLLSPGLNEPDQHPTISGRSEARRRRRWSILDSVFTAPESNETSQDISGSRSATLPSASGSRQTVHRSVSSHSVTADGHRGNPGSALQRQPSVQHEGRSQRPRSAIPPLPNNSTTNRTSRFIPRALTAALASRLADNNRSAAYSAQNSGLEHNKRSLASSAIQTPPPKLDFVKLSGTKGSLMLKAVETPRKSFLAILCGANGEKIELYAGTYRTNLGLSRTFILPDSPRTLELQLQGDDLVEVFLMFSHNVFGLEPATVRVREVRIGRTERRAARERRRARENALIAENVEQDIATIFEDDLPTDVNLHVNMTPAAISTTEPSQPSPFVNPPSGTQTPEPLVAVDPEGQLEELIDTAAMGPYTTFQQLSFAPNFPLASMADDCLIPPTYPEFLFHRSIYESDSQNIGNNDLASTQFSPPGLPVPVVAPPSRWFYQDPKGKVHGPWKAKLMQSWYKDGLLPPDLPVRREEESDFVPLKDLRQQSVDPSEPFYSSTPPVDQQQITTVPQNSSMPLLQPISLLAQPAHYGPPALFFSSRGGHSTTVVDARGRSVLKGRFVWSADNSDEDKSTSKRMGDITRLEAFDVRDRSVIVAMRQGGVEAMDLGDALLRPADESRAVLPHFAPPIANVNRRTPFVWKIGTPITSAPTSTNNISSGIQNMSLSKKATANLGKLTKMEVGSLGDADVEGADEMVFLGRKANEVFLCERQALSFRILRLSPTLND